MRGPFHQKPKQQLNEDWMLTYADCITLLLAFFVMMHTISEVNLAEFEKIKMEINSEFGSAGPTHGISDDVESPESTDMRANIPDPVVTPEHPLLDMMQEALEGLADQGDVALHATPDGVELEFNSSALYDVGKAEIKPEMKPVLTDVVERLRALDGMPLKITVEGHTDDVPTSGGRYATNWELSASRATHVVRYFIETGLSPQFMMATGFADTRPRATSETHPFEPIDARRQLNRRVVVRIER